MLLGFLMFSLAFKGQQFDLDQQFDTPIKSVGCSTACLSRFVDLVFVPLHPSPERQQVHSPIKPVLVFVSSRRQTRLTALDLITYAVAEERPQQFVHMPEEELQLVLETVRKDMGVGCGVSCSR